MLTVIDSLITTYKYKRLPYDLSLKVRDLYRKHIPPFLKEEGDNKKLYSLSNALIANAYERIVIGDYGAYVEFTEVQANKEAFIIAPKQGYRVTDHRYKDLVKFIWLTTEEQDIKIYYQKKPVVYADYKVGYYYVSILELKEN